MTNPSYRLNDAEIAQFIVHGYLTIKPDLPSEFHAEIFAQHEEIFKKEGNPDNNLLPRIPLLRHVFEDPVTVGALQSVIGDDYYLQPHRHPHRNPPKSQGQRMHQDGAHRWSHRTRYLLAFYYPQDTPLERGPSGIVPGSHYFKTPEGARITEELPLVTPAGTVTITNYELWHRAMPNSSPDNRYMVKFLFARMTEPTTPSWCNEQSDWPGAPPALEGDNPELAKMHEYVWHWHRAENSITTPQLNDKTSAALMQTIISNRERAAVAAAYNLAAFGKKIFPDLLPLLSVESEMTRYYAGYALSAMGVSAVDALAEKLTHENPVTRSTAATILGDIGLASQSATAELIKVTRDPDEDVRRRAAEALGNVCQGVPTAVPALIDLLKDPNPSIRQEATFALCRIGPMATDAISSLEEVLDDENRYVRGDALQALTRMETRRARDILTKHLMTARWCPITTSGKHND